MVYPFMRTYFKRSRIKDVLEFGRLPTQASFRKQTPLNTLKGSHLRDFWEVMDHHSIEELWFKCFGLSFCLNTLLVSPLQWCMSVPKSEKSAHCQFCGSPRIVEMHFLTTLQQNPWCYGKACEIQGTQGHTEHVFLSSSRLYALRTCHFRASFLLWTHSVWATSLRHGQKDETGFSLVKAAKILCEPHVCKEDQPSK